MLARRETKEGRTDELVKALKKNSRLSEIKDPTEKLSVLNKSVTRREAISTAGKAAIGVGAAIVIGGGAYAAYLASRPTPVTTTSTSTQTTPTTSPTTSATSSSSAAPFKIGLLAPLSGVLSIYGQLYPNGAQLAVDKLNETGGILGRAVQLAIADDKSDPAAAAEGARKLINQDKVDVLMGTVSSATTLAVIPISTEAKKPYIWVIKGEDKNCLNGDVTKTNKWVAGNGETPEMELSVLIPFLIQNFGKKFYFVGSDYVFPHYVNSAAKKIGAQLGMNVIGEEYAPLGTSEFSSILTRIKDAKPDVFFTDVVGADGVAVVQQFDSFGLKDKITISGVPSFDGEVLSFVADISEGAYTADRYTEDLSYQENKDFVARYKAKYNPQWPIADSASTCYDTVRLFKAAIEKAGSFDPEAIVNAFPGLTLNATYGPMHIDPENNLAATHMLLLQIKNRRHVIVKDAGEIKHPGLAGGGPHDGCSTSGA